MLLRVVAETIVPWKVPIIISIIINTTTNSIHPVRNNEIDPKYKMEGKSKWNEKLNLKMKVCRTVRWRFEFELNFMWNVGNVWRIGISFFLFLFQLIIMTVSVTLKPFHNSIIIKIKCKTVSDWTKRYMNYYEKRKRQRLNGVRTHSVYIILFYRTSILRNDYFFHRHASSLNFVWIIFWITIKF